MIYDSIIIGGGLSGLAAGIRLAHYGQKVLIAEQHSRLGGLNSYYNRKGFHIDTGLHAMTNFAEKGSAKSAPLLKLLRQLRIPYDDLMLREQNGSLIKFPNCELKFNNDFEYFVNNIKKVFPQEIDNFLRFNEFLSNYNELDLYRQYISARKVLNEYFKTPLLIEMLFCPIMYYGSAVEDDIDFSQFVIMFKSIFHQGFCRPAGEGVLQILNTLENRYKSCDGHLRLNCKITEIGKSKDIFILRTTHNEEIQAKKVLSSNGYIETLNLCKVKPANFTTISTGKLSYTETIAVIPDNFNIKKYQETIVFFNDSANFAYHKPQNIVSFNSGVICAPRNFKFTQDDTLPTNMLRITALSNNCLWEKLNKEEYKNTKNIITEQALSKIENIIGVEYLKRDSLFLDTMTPKTITRYTGHINGAIYGVPNKIKDGRTNIENLYICGTDQGFLGIVGAMLSGISMANMHLLK